MAALDMGSVRAMPTTTETTMPIRNGCSSVAHMITCPTEDAALPIQGAHQAARATPITIVTSGVTRMSIFVSLETSLPHSAANIAMNSTASGPPAPPRLLAAKPTAVSENKTSGGDCSAYPIARAIAGPAIWVANPPNKLKKATPVWVPTVLRMVPIRSEQNRPWAMAPKASMP